MKKFEEEGASFGEGEKAPAPKRKAAPKKVAAKSEPKIEEVEDSSDEEKPPAKKANAKAAPKKKGTATVKDKKKATETSTSEEANEDGEDAAVDDET